MKPIPLVILACLISFSTTSFAGDPWLDEVILFDQPDGSSNDGSGPEAALGEPGGDDNFVSIDIPETAIFAFTDNRVIDGEGNDLKLYEIINGDSNIEVYVSPDNINYTFLGTTTGNVEYDLADFGLSSIRFVKVVGLGNGGTALGYDLDAMEALNSEDRLPDTPSCSENTPTCAQNPTTQHWTSFAYRCDVPDTWQVSQTDGSECLTDNQDSCPSAEYENGHLHIPTVNVKLSDPFGGLIVIPYEVDMQLAPNATSLLFELTGATPK